jgi:glycosyltransferase involved in cell wall biosynthesis
MAKFTVVTACRNAAPYIEETVRSVLNQTVFMSGRCELEYLVRDGASTDGTLEILRRFERDGVQVVSQPDGGFYDALAKGLELAAGNFVAYLNAGDLLHPSGLSIAADCLELPGVEWVTGYAAVLNDRSQITHCWLPYRYRNDLFGCGAYGTILPFLQQESTVWRRSLHKGVDFERLGTFHLAGDSYLWKCFASLAQLYVVRGLIGGFRVHAGQKSERLDHYREELRSFARKASPSERLLSLADRAVWAMPERVKLLVNRSTLIRYDHVRQEWNFAARRTFDQS